MYTCSKCREVVSTNNGHDSSNWVDVYLSALCVPSMLLHELSHFCT